MVHYRAGMLPPSTVSIGVATYPEHGDTPEALLRVADQALYRRPCPHDKRATHASMRMTLGLGTCISNERIMVNY